MSVIRKTITITKQQDDWIKAQIAEGNYTSDSEVVRAAVRYAQRLENYRAPSGNSHPNAALSGHPNEAGLAQEIQKGLDSGISSQSFDDIILEVKQERRAKAG